jgi:hypothetical protein
MGSPEGDYQGRNQEGKGGQVMKIHLTEKQLETILEGLDFWQGSLTGIEEHATEYRRAERMYETLLEKAQKARA